MVNSVLYRLAPSVTAASSYDASIALKKPTSIKNMKEIVCSDEWKIRPPHP